MELRQYSISLSIYSLALLPPFLLFCFLFFVFFLNMDRNCGKFPPILCGKRDDLSHIFVGRVIPFLHSHFPSKVGPRALTPLHEIKFSLPIHPIKPKYLEIHIIYNIVLFGDFIHFLVFNVIVHAYIHTYNNNTFWSSDKVNHI